MRFYPTVNNNNNNTPVIPGADMPAIQSKLAGYWVDGEDQLSTSNLVDSGTSYTMPVSSELINATGLISLNTWFISGVAQAINKTSISNYCAGKQFYGNDTLIILKKDNYLTEAEETALLTHLEITAVHSYHANSTALFSRFTNTYSNNEKSRLDNVMRHLVNSGIYAATDHFYLALTSKGEEMRLDWINASNNLTNNGYSVYEVPYKGLAPQKGTYYTGANPDADSNISQNSAYLSFKMKYPFSQPQANYVFGAGATGVSGSIGMRPYYGTVSIGQGYDIRLLNNNPFYISIPSGKGYESTMVTNRTGAEITNFYAEGSNIGSSNAISYAPTTSEIKIGGEIAIRGNSNSNYVQHLAWGSELTAEQSILLTKIIDDFAEHQKYLDTEYIEVNGIKITPLKHGFKCVLGQQCIWNDLNTVYYSNDLGETVASSIALPTYGKQINFAHIFDNGKIIFGTVENRMFTTTTALSSLTEMTPTKNGSTYTLHTPIDANYPGSYYKGLRMGQNKSYLPDGREIKVWGNYCNVFEGASPVLVWYSFGDEVKVAFEFGQNQYFTDNGTFIGGLGGNLLGDASQPIKTRHMHSVHQDPNNPLDFYSSMGDYDRTEFNESKLLKHTIDPITENFTTTVAVEGSSYTRVKVSSLDFTSDGEMAFASDASYTETNFDERGWFKFPLSNIATPSLWNRIYYQGDGEPITLTNVYSNDFMLGGNAATGGTPGDFNNPLITFSEDLGVNTFTKNLRVPGNIFYPSNVEISPKVFVFLVMTDYTYQGMYSIKIDMTNATDLTL